MSSVITSPVSKQLKKGATLFFEGEKSEYIYYVTQGCLQVYSGSGQGRTVLGEVKAGEFVGELGVLQNIARSASVIAVQDSSLEQYQQSDFIAAISQSPEKVVKILHSLSFRTRNVALLGNKIAKDIADKKHKFSLNVFREILPGISRVFNAVKKIIYRRELALYKESLPEKLLNGRHEISKGRVLFCEGHESHYACRVISGKFEVVKSLHDSYEKIGFILPGEYIGEIGLLEGTPRSLTVVAVEDSELDVLDAEHFLQAVSKDFDSAYELIKSLSSREAKLHAHLRLMIEQYVAILNPSTHGQAKQLMQNISNISMLTGRMLERDLYKLQVALKQEAFAVQGMVETYYRYMAGEVGRDEMELANAEFRNLLKTLGLGALLIIPGSFITIPLIVKMAKSIGIDVLPKSRSAKTH